MQQFCSQEAKGEKEAKNGATMNLTRTSDVSKPWPTKDSDELTGRATIIADGYDI